MATCTLIKASLFSVVSVAYCFVYVAIQNVRLSVVLACNSGTVYAPRHFVAKRLKDSVTRPQKTRTRNVSAATSYYVVGFVRNIY